MYPTQREECQYALGDVDFKMDLLSKVSHSETKCRRKNSPRYIYRKYGLTSCKSPRKGCVRKGIFPKTSTPCDDVSSPANRKLVRGLAKKINSLHSKSGSTPRRNLSNKQTPSKHLQMLDLKLAKMKRKCQKLREKDIKMKERYELLKQRAEQALGTDVEPGFSSFSKATVADERPKFVHFEDGNGPVEFSVMLDSFSVKRNNLYIRADVCNVYYTESTKSNGVGDSPLKTILKDGRKCTFC